MDLQLAMFMNALEDTNPSVRENAIRAIGNMGHASLPALNSLVALFDDEDQDVRRWATWAVGRLDRHAVVVLGDLERMRFDTYDQVRLVADEAIDRVHGKRRRDGQWPV